MEAHPPVLDKVGRGGGGNNRAVWGAEGAGEGALEEGERVTGDGDEAPLGGDGGPEGAHPLPKPVTEEDVRGSVEAGRGKCGAVDGHVRGGQRTEKERGPFLGDIEDCRRRDRSRMAAAPTRRPLPPWVRTHAR